jgi:hypothetical protein
MGPDSDAQKEMVLALDRDINTFFTDLDKKVGLANVLVAFTADHGVAPIVRESAKLGVASASVDLEALTDAINVTLNTRFHTTKKTNFFLPAQEFPNLALDPGAFEPLHVAEAEAEAAVVEAIPAAIATLGPPPPPLDNPSLHPLDPTKGLTFSETRIDAAPRLAFVRSRVDLAAGKIPDTEFGHLIEHSYTDHGGWYVMVFPTAYQMEYLNGIQTTHYSPWSYDRHVPLGFFGADIIPGYYRDQVAPVDIAATFAAILGVNAPSSSVGHILTKIIAK